jgi:hypothetical protein
MSYNNRSSVISWPRFFWATLYIYRYMQFMKQPPQKLTVTLLEITHGVIAVQQYAQQCGQSTRLLSFTHVGDQIARGEGVPQN